MQTAYAAAALLALAAVAHAGADPMPVANPANLEWHPKPALPPGAHGAVVHGDPAKGEYGFFGRFPERYLVPKHFHTNDVQVAMMKGSMVIGGREGLPDVEIQQGGYFFLPAKMAYTAQCEKGCTFLAYGAQPFDIIYSDAKDDPRLAKQAQNKDPGRALIEKAGIARDKVERALAGYYDVEAWRFDSGQLIPEELRQNVRIDYFKQNGAAPVGRRGSAVLIAIDDPHDLGRTDAMRRLYSDRQVAFQVGFRDEIIAVIEASYGVLKGDVGSIIRDLSSSEGTGVADDSDEAATVAESDSTIIKLVNQIIVDACRRGSSDIHIEPQGRDFPCRIRFRIDSDCVEYQEVPAAFRQPLVARIKIMALLDIAEKRKPQDGKIKFNLLPEDRIARRDRARGRRRRGRGDAHPGGVQADAARPDGALRAQPP